MYGITQAAGMLASGLNRRALVIGADVLSKVMNFADRSTCVLFGDGAGAVVLEPVEERGFLGFELGADGAGGVDLHMPAGGSRMPTTAETVANDLHYVQMNGRHVFKFATRVLVSSAEALLAKTGVAAEDVDVYVPHQANVRIIDHAVAKLGIPEERVVVNVDRFGNTSSASIPLALADAVGDGRVKLGSMVLMTGMGAGLTWGSALMRWTEA
jgi:3-oxoacyl-[acyl-carrier-protein] synthase-3